MAGRSAQDAIVSPARRSTQRLRLRLPGSLILVGGTRQCTVHDLSRWGARIELPQPPAKGSEGILACLGLESFGSVVWIRGDYCGIHFDCDLGADMVIAARRLFDRYPDVEGELHRRAAKFWATGRVKRT
jgi:PilZ domain